MKSPPIDKLKVGIGQLQVVAGDAGINMQVALEFVAWASAQACDIVVLPECLDLGWTDPSASSAASRIPGPRSAMLSGAARDHRIFVVAGLTEIAEEGIFNTAVLIDDRGDILARHRKINILNIAAHIYSRGTDIGVVPTKLGRIGINICADLLPESNDLGYAQGAMGADMIFSPCSWAVPPDFDQKATPYGQQWKESYTAIAAKYQIPMVGVSNTGEIKGGAWAGWHCIGASLVIQSDGRIEQFPFSKNSSQLFTTEISL